MSECKVCYSPYDGYRDICDHCQNKIDAEIAQWESDQNAAGEELEKAYNEWQAALDDVNNDRLCTRHNIKHFTRVARQKETEYKTLWLAMFPKDMNDPLDEIEMTEIKREANQLTVDAWAKYFTG
jgi:molecular chaperone GrpE (heat shock protein)